MTGAIAHHFTSAKVDSADSTLVRPSNWNDKHALVSGAHGDRLIRDTTSPDGDQLVGYDPITLTNNVGETHVVGDIVTLDPGADTSTAYFDVQGAVRPYLAAQEAAAQGAAAIYARAGKCPAKVTGAVVRGNWLIKSATNKCLEDSGVPETATPPSGCVAVALQAAAGPGLSVILVNLLGTITVGTLVDGGTITAAATLPVSNFGQNFHVAGVTGVTAISARAVGTIIDLTFDNALTLTHNAVSLILHTGQNFTTAPGDTMIFKSEGGGNWREIGRHEAGRINVNRLGSSLAVGNGKFLRDDNDWTGRVIVEPESAVVVYEDFLSADSDPTGAGAIVKFAHPWWTVGALLSGAQGAGGIVRVAGDGVNIPALHLSNLGIAAVATRFKVANNPSVRVRIAQIGGAAATRRIGLTDSTFGAAAEPTNGIYFRFANAGNLLAICRAAGVEAPPLDTGIAMAVGVFHTARLVVSGGNLVTVFVDGVSKGTINTNLPTVLLGLGAGASILTAANGLDVDYIVAAQDR